MSLFNKYKPYLYDNLSDSEKKEIGTEIMTQIALNIETLKVPGLDDYLSSFDDLDFIANLVMGLVTIKPEKKIENINTSFLVNIVATLSSNELWNQVIKGFGKNTVEELTELLKNKDIPQDDFFVLEKVLSSNIEFFDNLNNAGVKVNKDISKEFDGVKNFSNIEKLVELLSSPIISDEEAKRNEIIKGFLDELWNEILPIYSELYKNAIESGCKGVLTKDGYFYYSNGRVLKSEDIWVNRLYTSFLDSSVFAFKINEKFKDLTRGDLIESNYLSYYHTLNAFGVKNIGDVKTARNWEELLPYMKKRFDMVATVLLKSYELSDIINHYNELKAILTNSIIIEKYDRSTSVQLTYKLDGVNQEFNSYFERNVKAITGRESCKVLKNAVSQNNVVSLFGVFDAKKFALEPLFSYQAYDNFVNRGGRVSLDKVIVGRNLDGSDFVYSLKSNDSRVTAIFAGSGSGKGVMTLGLLAAIVSNKTPFIYLDYKPDMAEMLWGIEQMFKDSGITRSDGKEARILAIDSKQDMDTANPVRKHRFAENLPDYLSTIPNTVFAVLPYLKLLQLYYVLGSLRAIEKNQPDFGGKMTFAILDEFQANMKENLSKLITTLDAEVKDAKQNKDERYKDVYKYVSKIKMLVKRLGAETGTFIVTDGRKSQCKAIYLGQNADYNIWSSDKVEEVASLTSEWYGKTSFRFFGRSGGRGSYYPKNTGVIEEFVSNKDTFGYWTSAAGAGPVGDVSDWQVFKAYSVLNENDFNCADPSSSGRCTSGVLNNIPDDSIKKYVQDEVFSVIDDSGCKVARPEVGFLGLVQKVSGFSDAEIADALSEGYEVIWKVMCHYGLNMIYPDVETYLFDASFESIYTTDEIRAGVLNKIDDTGVVGDRSEQVFGGDDFFADPTKTEEEKREAFQRQKEEQKKKAELEKKNEERNKILSEINELKSKYGTKISNDGKSLYSFKKDKVLFEDRKTAIMESRSVYQKGFDAVIDKVEDVELKNELNNIVTQFLNQKFSSIDSITFETIQDGRKDGEGTGGGNGIGGAGGANGAGDVGDVGGKGGPPAKQKGKISPATFNGQTIASDIDTGDMEYNTRKIDSMGNVKASRELTNRVIRDIKDQFGGVNNIDEITVNAGGSLIINGYGYAPKFGEAFMNSLGLAIKSEVQQGRIGRVVNLGQVVAAIMGNIFTLAIECPKTAMSDVFQAELGVRNGDYGRLFKNHRNLQTIYLPDQELTRDNPNQQRSGTGLGAKLAGLFGFGRGNRDSDNYVPNTATTNNGNSFIDQMYACKPVRILANAFGWTAGCQLVYLAATMLGPWGLVFGAFAAAGAYKEAKNGNQNNRNSGYSTNSRSGGSTSSRSSGQKSKNKKSNDFDE